MNRTMYAYHDYNDEEAEDEVASSRESRGHDHQGHDVWVNELLDNNNDVNPEVATMHYGPEMEVEEVEIPTFVQSLNEVLTKENLRKNYRYYKKQFKKFEKRVPNLRPQAMQAKADIQLGFEVLFQEGINLSERVANNVEKVGQDFLTDLGMIKKKKKNRKIKKYYSESDGGLGSGSLLDSESVVGDRSTGNTNENRIQWTTQQLHGGLNAIQDRQNTEALEFESQYEESQSQVGESQSQNVEPESMVNREGQHSESQNIDYVGGPSSSSASREGSSCAEDEAKNKPTLSPLTDANVAAFNNLTKDFLGNTKSQYVIPLESRLSQQQQQQQQNEQRRPTKQIPPWSRHYRPSESKGVVINGPSIDSKSSGYMNVKMVDKEKNAVVENPNLNTTRPSNNRNVNNVRNMNNVGSMKKGPPGKKKKPRTTLADDLARGINSNVKTVRNNLNRIEKGVTMNSNVAGTAATAMLSLATGIADPASVMTGAIGGILGGAIGSRMSKNDKKKNKKKELKEKVFEKIPKTSSLSSSSGNSGNVSSSLENFLGWDQDNSVQDTWLSDQKHQTSEIINHFYTDRGAQNTPNGTPNGTPNDQFWNGGTPNSHHFSYDGQSPKSSVKRRGQQKSKELPGLLSPKTHERHNAQAGYVDVQFEHTTDTQIENTSSAELRNSSASENDENLDTSLNPGNNDDDPERVVVPDMARFRGFQVTQKNGTPVIVTKDIIELEVRNHEGY